MDVFQLFEPLILTLILFLSFLSFLLLIIRSDRNDDAVGQNHIEKLKSFLNSKLNNLDTLPTRMYRLEENYYKISLSDSNPDFAKLKKSLDVALNQISTIVRQNENIINHLDKSERPNIDKAFEKFVENINDLINNKIPDFSLIKKELLAEIKKCFPPVPIQKPTIQMDELSVKIENQFKDIERQIQSQLNDIKGIKNIEANFLQEKIQELQSALSDFSTIKQDIVQEIQNNLRTLTAPSSPTIPTDKLTDLIQSQFQNMTEQLYNISLSIQTTKESDQFQKKATEKLIHDIAEEYQRISAVLQTIHPTDSTHPQLEETDKNIPDETDKNIPEETDKNKKDNYYQLYINNQQKIQEQGFQENEQRIVNAQKKFKLWRQYILTLDKTIEDEILYEFIEIVEKYAAKMKQVMVYPLNIAQKDQTEQSLKDLANHILEMSREKSVLANILQLPKITMRAGTELDYQIPEQDGKSISACVLQKQLINTILVTYKQLHNNFKKFQKLLSTTLKNEHMLYEKQQRIDYENLIPLLLSDEPDNEQKIHQQFESIDEIIQQNYEMSLNFMEKADKFEKQYITFVNQSIIKALSVIQESRKNFINGLNTEFKEKVSEIQDWKNLYSQLIHLFHNYLKQHLNIEPIETRRGDQFNVDIHMPYMEAEPDDTLDNNTIKTIINDGFIFDDEQKRIIFKPVDVIVVNNA